MARIFFALLFPALLLACGPDFAQVAETKTPEQRVKEYFPGTKPGSRGKAYTWWRLQSYAPDAVFDATFMSPKQLVNEYVRIGDFIVGAKVPASRHIRRDPPPHIGVANEKLLDAFYARDPNLLYVPPGGLKKFEKAKNKAIAKHGSVENMLDALNIDLRLTAEKATGIREGTAAAAGGKYIIASDGRAFFLTEKEIGRIMKDLDLESLNHGAIGVFISEVYSRPASYILDYGTVNIGGGERTTSEMQEAWNEKGKRFPSYQYLSRYR